VKNLEEMTDMEKALHLAKNIETLGFSNFTQQYVKIIKEHEIPRFKNPLALEFLKETIKRYE